MSVSDELDRLYGEHVWRLCEAGADLVTGDFDAGCVFVNLEAAHGENLELRRRLGRHAVS